MTTRIITPVDMQQVIEYLRENLTIDVETSSEYTGGMDDGPCYRDHHVIRLLLDGEVVSSASL